MRRAMEEEERGRRGEENRRRVKRGRTGRRKEFFGNSSIFFNSPMDRRGVCYLDVDKNISSGLFSRPRSLACPSSHPFSWLSVAAVQPNDVATTHFEQLPPSVLLI